MHRRAWFESVAIDARALGPLTDSGNIARRQVIAIAQGSGLLREDGKFCQLGADTRILRL